MVSADTLFTLEQHYPQTIAAFRSMGALDQLERIAGLDAAWAGIRLGRLPAGAGLPYAQGTPGAGPPAASYDLIYAGGGLGLLHAAVMARHGYRVLLFDQGEVGCAHREWNIGRAELAALVGTGFCSWDELRDIIMAEYEQGVVRFYSPARAAAELRLRNVLDVALDAGALLRLARRKLIEAGGVVLDRHSLREVVVSRATAATWQAVAFRKTHAGHEDAEKSPKPLRVLRALRGKVKGVGPEPIAVRVELADAAGARSYYWARLLLDGMGSASPLALRRFAGRPFAGVCPTVGTVASGFAPGLAANEHNPHIGDILISVANAQRGQQYLWEGFPGRGDDLTVYLFYYDTLQRSGVGSRELGVRGCQLRDFQPPSPNSQPPGLMQLFEDYFTLLPSYKRPGPGFRHLKPVYGYIPARHSLRRQEAPLLRGVLPIGDSAAQQSPLTFCGFGSHVRNLARTTGLLHNALQRGLTEPAHLAGISAYQANVSLNWVFSRFMQPWAAPGDVNRLQNIFLGLLNELGEDLARRFFRDEMRWGDYHRIVLGMFRRYPPIVLVAWRVLGSAGIARWVAGYLAFCRTALAARSARRLGVAGRTALLAALERLHPALALRLRAAIGEWQAMRWL